MKPFFYLGNCRGALKVWKRAQLATLLKPAGQGGSNLLFRELYAGNASLLDATNCLRQVRFEYEGKCDYCAWPR